MKKKFRLSNLDCANCADKIEQHLKKLPGLEGTSINFATLTLFTNSSDINQLRSEIKSIEPDVDIESWKVAQIEQEKELSFKPHKHLVVIAISTVLLVVLISLGKVFDTQNLAIVEYSIAILAYILSGWSVLVSAFKTIKDRQWFNEHALMAIATLGALAIHAFEEAIGVMIFYQIGELLQNLAVAKSRRSISSLLEIRPDYANLKTTTGIKRVSPEQVKPGDVIIVKAGEKIPLDGLILEGTSQINTAVLTGESVPQSVREGSSVLAGEINMTGMLTIKVSKPFSESSVTRILDLVENAASKKAKSEQFMTRFARYYTPAVVFVALLIAVLPPVFIEGQSFTVWIYRALVLLVISCPCALIVSIPLGYFGGIGGASRQGILVKGANLLDALSNVKSVIFDKTGTLTKGIFSVKNIVAVNGCTPQNLLKYAAMAEYHSNHPIAQSILKTYKEQDGSIENLHITEHQEVSGYGVRALLDGQEIIAGNEAFLNKETIVYPVCETLGTVVHVACDKMYLGYIQIGDELKEDSSIAIELLHNAGVDDVIMLTGDNFKAASEIATQLNLNRFYASLLPEQKVDQLEALLKEKSHQGLVAFVGDGINDAPVIARADVGIAMGALGSEAAIETADVVLMTDHPSKVAQAIEIGKRTRRIIIQNISMALAFKLVFVVLGSFGLATMWEAVFADVGVALLAVLNSSRALKVKSIQTT